jgi:hypothetical protein
MEPDLQDCYLRGQRKPLKISKQENHKIKFFVSKDHNHCIKKHGLKDLLEYCGESMRGHLKHST